MGQESLPWADFVELFVLWHKIVGRTPKSVARNLTIEILCKPIRGM